MFNQAVSQVQGAPLRRRGFRGLACGFDGLADTPGSDPNGVFYYQLPSGYVLYLPNTWNQMSAQQKRDYINTSNLPAQYASELEDESGLNDGSDSGGSGNPTTATQNARPSYDYVRAGDVVRVSMILPTGVYLDSGPVLSAIASRIATGNLTYVNGNGPGIFGSGFTVDVQPRNDFSHLIDVASIVQEAAQNAGYPVSGPATAAFVSKVESTGGQVVVKDPAKSGGNNNNGNGPQVSTNMLLVGGAALLLIVVLAKK